MSESNFDLIIGKHSIVEALNNPSRGEKKLYATDESHKDLLKSVKDKNFEVKLLSSHKVQEVAKQMYGELGYNYQRVPSNMFLTTTKVDVIENPASFYEEITNNRRKILCLDQVTDVHNAAAIMRTACFYGVDYLVLSQKGSFGVSPSFYRIASGAVEHVKILKSQNLSKLITNMIKNGVMVIGLSEHSKGELTNPKEIQQSLCLVLGTEETGLSNAVQRQIEHMMSLKSFGEIKSLNVSVAAAISMDRCFS